MILTPEDAASMTAKRVAQYPVGTVIIVTQHAGGCTTVEMSAKGRTSWLTRDIIADSRTCGVDMWCDLEVSDSERMIAHSIRCKYTVSVQVFTPDLTET